MKVLQVLWWSRGQYLEFSVTFSLFYHLQLYFFLKKKRQDRVRLRSFGCHSAPGWYQAWNLYKLVNVRRVLSQI